MAGSILNRVPFRRQKTSSESHELTSPLPASDHGARIDAVESGVPKKDVLEFGAEDVTHDTSNESEEPSLADSDPAVKDIPWSVRRVVSLVDDPNEPTLTFRYFVLSIIFVAPGAFLSQLSSYRTTYAPYSIFFVQICSNYAGMWMAKVLPAKRLTLPFTTFGFSLNPGPWSTKEHVLITISAGSGAMYNLGYAPISIAELYFDTRINAGVAIVFMYCCVITGYSFAAISRQFLLYDPQYPWFQALCQTALFETQKKDRIHPSARSRKQMKVFFSVLVGVILWQFLPEYVFPMLGSLAFLCWVAPENATANFLGSGLGGMGFLNLSLDWSEISANTNLFLTPYWTQVIMFAAFVVNCWVLIPAVKWGSLSSYKHGLMSTKTLQANGTKYPLTSLITSSGTLNETVYEEYGPLYLGAQMLWGIFFSYAAYTSAWVWALLFGLTSIKATIKKIKERRQNHDGKSVNHQFDDQLNIIMRSYQEVPLWWYVTLFGVSFVAMMAILGAGQLYIPIWTYFIAVATGAAVVTPLGWLYAMTNYQLPIGTFNELLYGVMVNAVKGHHNPTGATVYSSLAGDAWYRAQTMLQDQKIGHYTHIPPRATFFSQIFGCTIGVPINFGVVRWVLSTKREILLGQVPDPSNQWTAQSISQSLSTSVQYVLVGPTRMFNESRMRVLPYGFVLGVVAPILFYALHCAYPKSWFQWRLWNTTIFFSCLTNFYGNTSTGYTSAFIGSFVVMHWAYRYRYNLWARYNYLLAAAFDAGFNFNQLLIFLMFGSGKVIAMANWWGNNADNSERCFALDS